MQCISVTLRGRVSVPPVVDAATVMVCVWSALLVFVVPDTATVCVCAAPVLLVAGFVLAGPADTLSKPKELAAPGLYKTPSKVCAWLALALPVADDASENVCVWSTLLMPLDAVCAWFS